MSTITATFYNREATERAVEDLIAAGVSREDISVLMSDDTREHYFAREGNVRGAAVANAIGALAGAVPEPEVQAIEHDVQAGGVILAVRAPHTGEAVRAILRDDGGTEPGTTTTRSAATVRGETVERKRLRNEPGAPR